MQHNNTNEKITPLEPLVPMYETDGHIVLTSTGDTTILEYIHQNFSSHYERIAAKITFFDVQDIQAMDARTAILSPTWNSTEYDMWIKTTPLLESAGYQTVCMYFNDAQYIEITCSRFLPSEGVKQTID